MSNPVVILNLPRVVDTGGICQTVAAANIDSFSTTTTNSEISDEEETDVTSVNTITSVNSVEYGNHQEPTINVVNSSDVVIGSVTQFHGPVTIVQHLPKHLPIDDNKSEANLVTTDYTASSSKNPPATCLPKRLLVCFATITVLMALIALSIILSIDTQFNNTTTSDDPDLDEDTFEGNSSLKYNISGHHFFTVEAWGGRDALYEVSVSRPIVFVIVSHTAGRQCHSFTECAAIMRNIQGFHVTNGHPDVGYNFVIGGDGNIYEGRGWFTRNFHRDFTIGICFIGNYVYDELTDSMIDAFGQLLEAGVYTNAIPSTFQLVAHNQTTATLSPGQNVYRLIKHHPKFYPNLVPSVRNMNYSQSVL